MGCIFAFLAFWIGPGVKVGRWARSLVLALPDRPAVTAVDCSTRKARGRRRAGEQRGANRRAKRNCFLFSTATSLPSTSKRRLQQPCRRPPALTKGGGQAARCVDPVDDALPVGVLVVCGGAVQLVGQAVPVLSHREVGGRGLHIVLHVAAVEALDKVQPAGLRADSGAEAMAARVMREIQGDPG